LIASGSKEGSQEKGATDGAVSTTNRWAHRRESARQIRSQIAARQSKEFFPSTAMRTAKPIPNAPPSATAATIQ